MQSNISNITVKASSPVYHVGQVTIASNLVEARGEIYEMDFDIDTTYPVQQVTMYKTELCKDLKTGRIYKKEYAFVKDCSLIEVKDDPKNLANDLSITKDLILN